MIERSCQLIAKVSAPSRRLPVWMGLLLASSLVCASVPATAATRIIIIAGLGGEAEYERRFREQSQGLTEAAQQLAGKTNVVSLASERATRDAIRREMRVLASKTAPSDQVIVLLIGHGTYDGEEYRFNLPGPDMTASELRGLFEQLPARDQLIVNGTSASGAVVERWRRDGRVIISATKSGGERTATRFMQFWVDAVRTAAADVNKDEVVTATEAFEFATRKVAESFKADVALATEHARLEGTSAERFQVARLGAAARLASNAALSGLFEQRGRIEQDLNAVKQRRQLLQSDAYYDELEDVLVKLALLQQQIDATQTSGEEAVQ